MSEPSVPHLPPSIAADVAAVNRIGAVPAILKVACQSTGMGFAAIARVTDDSWTACAVHDSIAFGLEAGGQLEVKTTLCHEARLAQRPVVFDDALNDPVFREHHTPRIYGLRSYISVPIVRTDGSYFGNLCAIDPGPHCVSDERTVTMFQLFAELIALQLDGEERERASVAALSGERKEAGLREEFIAVLGHDLRNPLAAISAAAAILTRRESEPEGVKIGLRLQRSVRRMALLVNDVMDFARGRLGSGLGIASEVSSDLGAALRGVVQELRDANPDRRLVERIADFGPTRCDVPRVQQLLSNLLGNAMTHGAVDEPVIVRAEVNNGWLDVSVSNAGTAIAADDLSRMFEPYWRPAGSRLRGGLGLGLYICSQIVKAHGGSLKVTSTDADGTTFTAMLPVAT